MHETVDRVVTVHEVLQCQYQRRLALVANDLAITRVGGAIARRLNVESSIVSLETALRR